MEWSNESQNYKRKKYLDGVVHDNSFSQPDEGTDWLLCAHCTHQGQTSFGTILQAWQNVLFSTKIIGMSTWVYRYSYLWLKNG